MPLPAFIPYTLALFRSGAFRAITAVLAILLGSTGCAVTPGKAALEDRVRAYWEARRQADLGAAYEFYSAEFRKQFPRPKFLSSFQRLARFPPTEFRILDGAVSADGRSGTVKVQLLLRLEFEGREVELLSTTDDVWVIENGKWWKKGERLLPDI